MALMIRRHKCLRFLAWANIVSLNRFFNGGTSPGEAGYTKCQPDSFSADEVVVISDTSTKCAF